MSNVAAQPRHLVPCFLFFGFFMIAATEVRAHYKRFTASRGAGALGVLVESLITTASRCSEVQGEAMTSPTVILVFKRGLLEFVQEDGSERPPLGWLSPEYFRRKWNAKLVLLCRYVFPTPSATLWPRRISDELRPRMPPRHAAKLQHCSPGIAPHWWQQ